MGKILLKQGDRIYRTAYDQINQIVTIERITRTQAIAKGGDIKFKIEVSQHGRVEKIGDRERFSVVSWFLENDELINKRIHQNSVAFIKRFDFSSLPNDSLKKIMAIINAVTPNNEK